MYSTTTIYGDTDPGCHLSIVSFELPYPDWLQLEKSPEWQAVADLLENYQTRITHQKSPKGQSQ